jgi:hypothetical protein
MNMKENSENHKNHLTNMNTFSLRKWLTGIFILFSAAKYLGKPWR